MAKEFRLQDPGEGLTEAEIQEIHVSPGDSVNEGDTVLTIETDKATNDIPAPFSGTVEEISVQVGDVAQVGDVLMTYTEAGESTEEKTEEGAGEEKAKEEAKKKTSKEKRAEEEKVDKGKKEKQAEREKPQPAPSGEGRPVPASPATRRLARELGVDLRQVEPSGPEGRVTGDDVRQYAEQGKPEKAVAEEKPAEERRKREIPTAALPDFKQWGSVERRPLRSIRRTTARQMALSWSQIPHVMHQDMADITELEQFRRSNQETVEARGGKLTMTVLMMKALVAVLKQFPRFNASVDLESEEIILKDYYHIGVATATEQGLLVPVVRDVDRKSIVELAVELTQLTEKTRNGQVTRDELRGGTMTVTNPGAIGGTVFTPIIRYPEVAILGLAQARLEQVVQGDLDAPEVETRLRLPLCLAFDHRANDGADAARFVRALSELVADPESFLLST